MKILLYYLFTFFFNFLNYFLIGDYTLFVLLGIMMSLMGVPLIFNTWREKQRNKQFRKADMHEIDCMSGREFEDYLLLLFKELGYKVKGTPASGDFGADLIIEGPKKIVVQAKRYKKRVGVRAVQEIASACTYYDATEAWVITNNYYTESAERLAKKSGIRLIDRNELTDLIIELKESS